jgi:hypothetical protein
MWRPIARANGHRRAAIQLNVPPAKMMIAAMIMTAMFNAARRRANDCLMTAL